ncbi:MAG: AsmA family protein [Kiritimatiellae bacterium]|nr:AsmA family protein [Kiritimatiellia bacterium]
MGKAKKGFKIIMGLLVTVVVLVVALVVALPVIISPVVKQVGPKLLGVPVSVESVGVNPFTGSLAIKDVKIGNPEGFSEKEMFAVNTISVKMDLASLKSDTIIIKDITILEPAIRYEKPLKGKSNFETLLDNLGSGEKDQKEPSAEKKDEKKEGEGKKVVIEHFLLKGSKMVVATGVTLGAGVPVPTPDIELNNIGKKGGGITAIEATREVLTSMVTGLAKAAASIVTGAAEAAGTVVKGTAGAIGDAASGLKNLVTGGDKAAKDAKKDAKEAGKEAKEAGKGLLNAVKSLGK